jgi:Tol biopolymer transport system component
MNANGANKRQLTDDGISKTHATWSPDGNWIMFQTSPNDSLEIIKVDGTNRMALAESIRNPEWIASY